MSAFKIATVTHFSILGRIGESLDVRKVDIPKEYCMFHRKSTIWWEASRNRESHGAATLGPGPRGLTIVKALHQDAIGAFKW